MQEQQFLDRILSCVDCHGEFIFTAGEQLFFFDKQFKNDPKRCKPCKSRRAGLAAAANGATGPLPAGLSRTETRTNCSDCGVETTVPFKPTQGRPVLCRQCFQLKNRAAAAPLPIPIPAPGQPSAQVLTLASAEAGGAVLSPDAALVAAVAMASASPQSSVANSADLAYVASLNAAISHAPMAAPYTAQLIAGSPSDLLNGVSPSAELQPAPVEALQA